MDKDLYEMTHDEMIAEVRRLRNAIRHHRDQEGNDRCWLDDVELYAVLPEKTEAKFQLPCKTDFLADCARTCEKFFRLRQPSETKDES